MSVHAIDLRHQDIAGAVASWLILDGDPALVDPGPATTLDALREGLARHGIAAADLRHLLITHVHLDHAGAAGWLAQENPRLRVHVHRDGAPHLAEPERLVASTRRTFGEAHDRLWGEVRPVPRDAIEPWDPRRRLAARGVRALSTPGHIAHHLAWLHEPTGTLLAGDALGIVLDPRAPSHPATPPPAVDLEAWRRTLDELRVVGPERAGLAHFGLHGDVAGRADRLQAALDALEARVRRALAEGRAEEDALAFEEESRAAVAGFLPRERVDRYFDAFRAATDWRGVQRYVERNPTTEA